MPGSDSQQRQSGPTPKFRVHGGETRRLAFHRLARQPLISNASVLGEPGLTHVAAQEAGYRGIEQARPRVGQKIFDSSKLRFALLVEGW